MAHTLSQQIGDSGEDKFRDLLPFGWLKHKRDPDPHTDFLVERVVNNELTGEKVFVQVKTVQRTPAGKATAKIEVSTLKFAKRSRMPVFVVLIDLETNTGRFVFLTEYVDQLIDTSKIWNQKFHAVRIPTDSDIHDSDIFGFAVEKSWKYMSEKFPGSLSAAASAAENAMMESDDRFNVIVKFDGGKTEYLVTPRHENVECKMEIQASSSEAKEQLSRFVKFGGSLNQSDGLKIVVSDMPGKKGMAQECGGVTIENSSAGTIKWELLDENQEVISSHLLTAEISRGITGVVMSATLEHAGLFSCRFEIDFESADKKMQIDFNMSLDLSAWDGLSVSSLPSFYELEAMFQGIEKAQSVRTILINGGYEIPGVATVDQVDVIRATGEVMDLLVKLRKISKHCDVDFEWNLIDVWESYDQICNIHDLMFVTEMECGSVNLVVGNKIDPKRRAEISDSESLRHERDVEIDLLNKPLGKFREIYQINGFESLEFVSLDNDQTKISIVPKCMTRSLIQK